MSSHVSTEMLRFRLPQFQRRNCDDQNASNSQGTWSSGGSAYLVHLGFELGPALLVPHVAAVAQVAARLGHGLCGTRQHRH
eukprot:scaffold51474_cov31-Prasinocladus_malaysianus.AAC.1